MTQWRRGTITGRVRYSWKNPGRIYGGLAYYIPDTDSLPKTEMTIIHFPTGLVIAEFCLPENWFCDGKLKHHRVFTTKTIIEKIDGLMEWEFGKNSLLTEENPEFPNEGILKILIRYKAVKSEEQVEFNMF